MRWWQCYRNKKKKEHKNIRKERLFMRFLIEFLQHLKCILKSTQLSWTSSLWRIFMRTHKVSWENFWVFNFSASFFRWCFNNFLLPGWCFFWYIFSWNKRPMPKSYEQKFLSLLFSLKIQINKRLLSTCWSLCRMRCNNLHWNCDLMSS